MVIIVMPDGRDWFKANWAFRQLAEDISRRCPDDEELRSKLDLAQAFGCLDLKETPEALRQRIIQSMRDVINATKSGQMSGLWGDDHAGQAMYLESLSELGDLIAMLQS